MVNVNISQVSFYLLQLVLEIVYYMAILMRMEVLQTSVHKGTQFFYIWYLMYENHRSKENHTEEMTPDIYWFIMELKEWLKYRLNWSSIANSVPSPNEFIIYKV